VTTPEDPLGLPAVVGTMGITRATSTVAMANRVNTIKASTVDTTVAMMITEAEEVTVEEAGTVAETGVAVVMVATKWK